MLDLMQLVHNQIMCSCDKDDNFLLKTFNALEKSTDDEFLGVVKKKRCLWDENMLDDDADSLISACTKTHDNTQQSAVSKNKGNSKQENSKQENSKTNDDQNLTFLALLTQLEPAINVAVLTTNGGN